MHSQRRARRQKTSEKKTTSSTATPQTKRTPRRALHKTHTQPFHTTQTSETTPTVQQTRSNQQSGTNPPPSLFPLALNNVSLIQPISTISGEIWNGNSDHNTNGNHHNPLITLRSHHQHHTKPLQQHLNPSDDAVLAPDALQQFLQAAVSPLDTFQSDPLSFLDEQQHNSPTNHTLTRLRVRRRRVVKNSWNIAHKIAKHALDHLCTRMNSKTTNTSLDHLSINLSSSTESEEGTASQHSFSHLIKFRQRGGISASRGKGRKMSKFLNLTKKNILSSKLRKFRHFGTFPSTKLFPLSASLAQSSKSTDINQTDEYFQKLQEIAHLVQTGSKLSQIGQNLSTMGTAFDQNTNLITTAQRHFATKATTSKSSSTSNKPIRKTTKNGTGDEKIKTKSKKESDLDAAQNDASSQYKRMSQREHILLRPEPYIGSSECITERVWVLTKPLSDGEDGQVVDVDFNFIPGLYKIFDEILVNAADNVHRNTPSTKMSYIDIGIDPVTNLFSIENDGASIPVVMHNKEDIYVPELIFGHLLTSSNYDDTEARFTGGRHGFGAKLTNIFSKRFIITIADVERGVIYRQEFTENMSKIHQGLLISIVDGTVKNTKGVKVDVNKDPELAPVVKHLLQRSKHKDFTNFTKIEFHPDLERFQVDRLTFLPTAGSVQGEVSHATPAQNGGAVGKDAKDVSATKATLAAQEKAHRALQKKQLTEILTKSDPAQSTQQISSASTDNNFHITLNKSPELNMKLQSDPYSAFPPFLLPLFERRITDIGALMGNFNVKVSYQGKTLKNNNYAKYLAKCPSFPQPDPTKKNKKGGDDTEDDDIDDENIDKLTGSVVTTWLDKHWFVAISQRPQFHNTNSGTQSLNQLSFVNSVATTRGGAHVHYVTDIIARHIVNYLNNPARKKRWGLDQDVTIGLVKNFLCVFVSCFITNPSFDTQTKDTLITHIKGPQSVNPGKSAFVEAPTIPESFLKQICLNTGIIQNIALSLQQRQHKQLARKLDGPKRISRSGGLSIEKLDDALWAGTDRAGECTLILTEGDSAKALAVSGLSVLGRERFGVYPLKGKMLNVRDASKTSIAGNKEMVEIMQILGLKMTSNDRSHLRYGSVLVMADQDHDGSHIKGLLMNALHVLCPDLVKQQIHQVSPYPEQSSAGMGSTNNASTVREVTSQQLEVMEKPYDSNLPSNLKLNTSQHHFVRLFVTPIVKATWVGADYPQLSLQKNLNYHRDLLDFQAKYGHLTPKQIDQLNATRKMLSESKRDGERAIEGGNGSDNTTKNAANQKKSKTGTHHDDGDDDHQFEAIAQPEQYNTTITFAKTPQQDEHHREQTPSPNYKGKAPKPTQQTSPEAAVKRVNDAITVRGKVISFYSQFAYKLWWDKLPPALQRRFKCKYYKGLGTSTSAEGKEYFSDLPSHIIDLLHRTRHDDQSLNLAFSKDAVENRKTWVMDNSRLPPSDEYIRSYNKHGAYKTAALQLYGSPSGTGQSGGMKNGQEPHHIASKYLASRYTTINEFIHNELVQFSVADTIRSLPSTLDGFKPSQRKITYAALTKPLNNELRVSQFSAFVAERLVYHHGEQSLTAAIVNLAQDYPGTNNIPLLTGVGQFGTRHTGGKDHASARYIYTKTGPLTQELFPSADFPVLPQQTEEGTVIEPIHLLPILPMMIINGSSGIGTGYSTDIPAHNPLHVMQAVIQWLNGQPMRLIAPFNVGMTAQLYPQGVYSFNQKHWSLKMKTIDQIDLSKEVQIPKIDAPWEVVPLVDTTDATKKYSYDLSYGVNDVVQHGILKKTGQQLYNDYSTPELITEVVQFTLDNQPIITQNAKVLQMQARKHRLQNGYGQDVEVNIDSGDNSGLLGIKKGRKTTSKKRLNSDNTDDSQLSDVFGSEEEISSEEMTTEHYTESEEVSSESEEVSIESEEVSSESEEVPVKKPSTVVATPASTPAGPQKPHSPQEKIRQLQEQLAKMQSQNQAKAPAGQTVPQKPPTAAAGPAAPPTTANKTTTSNTTNTTQQPERQLSPHLDLSYLDRTDIAITKWSSYGKYFMDHHSPRTIHIVELPAGVTTAAYKSF